ncbi:DNA-3-methyladenine glycosylase 2 family protein [Mycobacterium hodleri]|uniref:DNA-3-methyladenine glycosylase family protein n=1 Tax=Mycolicibacterium hodleri TaxID=49897 RepID=UPI0021F30272|nr:DNA-3-methyladenine glycosylase 2 family protein [Mycolicibacterium hodleri]MCV7134285.1 DNA-3-methyladenine glycosylase 2 family protein [Mycolicibacterium hodleri]
MTLSPQRRGPGDPCYQLVDGAIWKTSLLPSGPVTARIVTSSRTTVDCEAWGAGAPEFLDRLPALLGVDDDATGFAPEEPTIAVAHRRVPHLRLGRTNQVLEALVPAVLEQRVAGKDAFRAWRLLVTKFGSPAPGPAPERMRVPPPADVWRRIPSWEFHLANVDPGRARTLVGCAQRADALERLSKRPSEDARTALMTLPGVGIWTAAEVAQRAWGDADALSVGDYHLSNVVGSTLLGHRIDDEEMLVLLEPLRPHRFRAVRLLEVSGLARNPRFGARMAIPNLRAL